MIRTTASSGALPQRLRAVVGGGATGDGVGGAVSGREAPAARQPRKERRQGLVASLVNFPGAPGEVAGMVRHPGTRISD